eukprot:1707941-Pyramimonas_sp.AAC.1
MKVSRPRSKSGSKIFATSTSSCDPLRLHTDGQRRTSVGHAHRCRRCKMSLVKSRSRLKDF